MNNSITSKDKILEVSRKTILKKGFSSVSMRTIAAECKVAVGSIYNYFPSKLELVSATIESVWEEIFMPINDIDEFDSFVDCVSCMFETIKEGDKKYPGFFSVHSLNFAVEDRDKGRKMMENYFGFLKKKLILSLEKDKCIREEVFQNNLTMEIFVDYVFTLMISILLKKQDECLAFLEMIKNSIY